MTKNRGEALYRDAFERIKSGATRVVDVEDPSFRISTTTVAIEAGKQKGFIRKTRYPELYQDILDAERERKQGLPSKKAPNKKSPSDRYKKLLLRHEALQAEYEVCLEKMLNLIRLNYDLKAENEQLKSELGNVKKVKFGHNSVDKNIR